MEKGYFYSLPQQGFNLRNALESAATFPFRSFQHEQDMEQYKAVVRDFLKCK